MAEVVSARLGDDLLARLDDIRGEMSRGAFVVGLIERELAHGGELVPVPAREVTHEVPPGGIPSPGVPCSWPSCWDRDTRRYGVTRPAELERTDYREQARDERACGLPLCPACAARVGGLIYRRRATPPRAALATAGASS